MADDPVFKQLETLILKTEPGYAGSVPRKLKERLIEWKWGAYGWISPSNLIITASWRKMLHPNDDCCKIWSTDENNHQIPGGYSIRTEDERYTVPLFSRYDLCRDFCSPNSGMQGSRAIEKMRSLRRVNRDFQLAQRVIFDENLFANILNDINELNFDQSQDTFRFIIGVAKNKKVARDESMRDLDSISLYTSFFEALSSISDPEFPKCVAAACLEALFSPSGAKISGVSDHKTAADARAEKPGDISISFRGEVLVAVEVKDRSRNLSLANIAAAREIVRRHPSIETFIFVLENEKAATSDEAYQLLESSKEISSFRIILISLLSLVSLSLPTTGLENLVKAVSSNLKLAPSIRASTIQKWIETLSPSGRKG